MEKRLKKNTMLGKIGKTRDTEMNLKKRRNESKKKTDWHILRLHFLTIVSRRKP